MVRHPVNRLHDQLDAVLSIAGDQIARPRHGPPDGVAAAIEKGNAAQVVAQRPQALPIGSDQVAADQILVRVGEDEAVAVVAGYQIPRLGGNAANLIVVRQGNADSSTVRHSSRTGDIGSYVISLHKIS